MNLGGKCNKFDLICKNHLLRFLIYLKGGLEFLPFLSQLVLSKSFDLLSSTRYAKTICKTCLFVIVSDNLQVAICFMKVAQIPSSQIKWLFH